MKYKNTIVTLSTMLLLAGVITQLHAEQDQIQGISYSYDHWPKRWSTAIHRQHDTHFPARQTSPRQVHPKEKAISGRDLFYLPSTSQLMNFTYSPKRTNARLSHDRYMRNTQTTSRVSSYAYYKMRPMYFNTRFGSPYGGFAMNSGLPGIDPVMGMHGFGIPFMPYRYPMPDFQTNAYWGTPYSNW